MKEVILKDIAATIRNRFPAHKEQASDIEWYVKLHQAELSAKDGLLTIHEHITALDISSLGSTLRPISKTYFEYSKKGAVQHNLDRHSLVVHGHRSTYELILFAKQDLNLQISDPVLAEEFVSINPHDLFDNVLWERSIKLYKADATGYIDKLYHFKMLDAVYVATWS